MGLRGWGWGGELFTSKRCHSLSSNDFTLWRLSICWLNAAHFTCICCPSIIHPVEIKCQLFPHIKDDARSKSHQIIHPPHLHRPFGQVNSPSWMVGQASGFGRNQLGGPEANRKDPDNLVHCNWIQRYSALVSTSALLCVTHSIVQLKSDGTRRRVEII